MAPSLSSIYSLSFFLALCATIFIVATLRLLAVLPARQPQAQPWRKRPVSTRLLIVLGSGGHTHEMFCLLKGLDTRKWTHRNYIISSGDAFSAQRAVEFEKQLEEIELDRQRSIPKIQVTDTAATPLRKRAATLEREPRPVCVGPEHYTISTIPRARKIYQPLLTTPISCLRTLFSALLVLLRSPKPSPAKSHEASDIPDLIITNGPATAVIVVIAAFLLRFFNFRAANTRGMCKTIYVESFARVESLSLSGKILVKFVDRFLVQWEELDGVGGRAEYGGMLVGWAPEK